MVPNGEIFIGRFSVDGFTQNTEKKISEKKLGGQLNQIEAQMFSSLKRRIPFTFVLITTAPMVGLLGTVSGMNTTFSGMADASSAGPSSVIAEGVSKL